MKTLSVWQRDRRRLALSLPKGAVTEIIE